MSAKLIIQKVVSDSRFRKVRDFVVRKIIKDAEDSVRNPVGEEAKDELKARAKAELGFGEPNDQRSSYFVDTTDGVEIDRDALGRIRFKKKSKLTEKNGTGLQQEETNVSVEVPPMWDADP